MRVFLHFLADLLGRKRRDQVSPERGMVRADLCTRFGEVDPGICQRVLDLLTEVLSVDPEELWPETRFIEDLQADELEPVEIAMAIEEEFGLYLSDIEGAKIRTVGDLGNWVERRLR